VFGESAQPIQVRPGRDVSQVRVVMATQLGSGVPCQPVLVQKVTGAVIRRPASTTKHNRHTQL